LLIEVLVVNLPKFGQSKTSITFALLVMLSGDVVSGLFPVGKVASCLAITRDVIT